MRRVFTEALEPKLMVGGSMGSALDWVHRLVAQHLQHRLAAHPDLDLVAVAGGPASVDRHRVATLGPGSEG